MKWLIRCLLTIVWTGLLGACASESQQSTPAQRFYQDAEPPASILALLKTIKGITDNDLFAHDDFYTEEHLKQLFGAAQTVKVTQETTGSVGMYASIYKFGDLVPAELRSSPVNGIYVDARKISKDDHRHLAEYVAALRINMYGITEGLDFKAVTGIFGEGWTENRQAENDKFMAITREPFNPPPPPATAYMGNAIVTYDRPKTTIDLEFTAGGTLWMLTCTSKVSGR